MHEPEQRCNAALPSKGEIAHWLLPLGCGRTCQPACMSKLSKEILAQIHQPGPQSDLLAGSNKCAMIEQQLWSIVHGMASHRRHVLLIVKMQHMLAAPHCCMPELHDKMCVHSPACFS